MVLEPVAMILHIGTFEEEGSILGISNESIPWLPKSGGISDDVQGGGVVLKVEG